jgi:hypothetical protein
VEAARGKNLENGPRSDTEKVAARDIFGGESSSCLTPLLDFEISARSGAFDIAGPYRTRIW